MLSNWKTRFQSFIVDTSGEAAQEADSADDSQVSHLQRMLADLRRSQDGPYGAQVYESPSGDRTVIEAAPGELPEVAAAPSAATVQESDADPTDEAFEAARQFIDEHRDTVQSLLHELGALEECVKSRARVTDAFNEYAVAKQRAADATAEEQQAKKLVEETAERHRSLQCRRKDADERLEPARAEVRTAQEQIAGLQEQLRSAQQLVEQKSAELQECEAQAKDYAAGEAAAASEAAKAAERHAVCRSANATVEGEAQAAKARAESLKKEAGEQSVAAIGDVRKLAMKIAGVAPRRNGST